MRASPAEEADKICRPRGAFLMTNSGCEDVARRAYELFLARGAGHGLDLEDWLEAERQLTATTATSARRRTVPAKATKRRSGARQTQAT